MPADNPSTLTNHRPAPNIHQTPPIPTSQPDKHHQPPRPESGHPNLATPDADNIDCRLPQEREAVAARRSVFGYSDFVKAEGIRLAIDRHSRSDFVKALLNVVVFSGSRY